MTQPIETQKQAAAFVHDLQSIWSAWEPSLVRGLALLDASSREFDEVDPAELAEEIRKVQYQAHLANERTASLSVPAIAAKQHHLLCELFEACRDTLGVLAIRADLGELTPELTTIGVHALNVTVDGWSGAVESVNTLPPMVVAVTDADASSDETPRQKRRGQNILWGMVVISTVLLVLLLLQTIAGAPVPA